mmetsp:Transcript_61282/g.145925  ORF Transcript_61282/g.145925 Transcript_61282/m.145925 type:complete len:210 (+) Transcript_61282:403-1032(+)
MHPVAVLGEPVIRRPLVVVQDPDPRPDALGVVGSVLFRVFRAFSHGDHQRQDQLVLAVFVHGTEAPREHPPLPAPAVGGLQGVGAPSPLHRGNEGVIARVALPDGKPRLSRELLQRERGRFRIAVDERVDVVGDEEPRVELGVKLHGFDAVRGPDEVGRAQRMLRGRIPVGVGLALHPAPHKHRSPQRLRVVTERRRPDSRRELFKAPG